MRFLLDIKSSIDSCACFLSWTERGNGRTHILSMPVYLQVRCLPLGISRQSSSNADWCTSTAPSSVRCVLGWMVRAHRRWHRDLDDPSLKMTRLRNRSAGAEACRAKCCVVADERFGSLFMPMIWNEVHNKAVFSVFSHSWIEKSAQICIQALGIHSCHNQCTYADAYAVCCHATLLQPTVRKRDQWSLCPVSCCKSSITSHCRNVSGQSQWQTSK